MRCRYWLIAISPTPYCLIQKAGVFVIVAVQAEQFPIASVRWIIVMIVVFVMHSQLAQPHSRKLAATSPAYPWE